MTHVLILVIAILLCIQIVPNDGSRKKGVSAWGSNLLCEDWKALNNISWWYDWKSDLSTYDAAVTNACPPSTHPMPEFVAMAWKSKWNNRTHMNFTSQAKYILGFNEPDQTEQANMTPETVAGLWPDNERNSNGRPLVSPVTAHHDFKWLDEFFCLCNNCRVDYIAAHAYNCDANHIITYLQRVHNRYSWFMARMLRIFDGGFMHPSAALLHNETSTLTRLGNVYNNFQPGDHASIVG